MESAVKRASRRLTGGGRALGSGGGGSGGTDCSAAEEANVASMLDALLLPWVEEDGVSTRERAARESAAEDIRSAHLYQFRFATEAEEMAWLQAEMDTMMAASSRGSRLLGPQPTLAEDGLATPSQVWEKSAGALPRSLHSRISSLGPNVRFDGPISRLPGGWQAPGNVEIGPTATSLYALPDGLLVAGTLTLLRTAVSTLPTRLEVGGDLVLDHTAGLTALPSDMRVGGSLRASHCAGISSLPDNLAETVRGSLAITWCERLTSVPPLHVRGSLSLEGCEVASLPEALRVDGGLNLSYTALAALPWDGLHVRGDLVMKGCEALTSLPDRLRVDGTLDVSDSSKISILPEALRVDGDVVLGGLERLTALPAGLRPSKQLSVVGCTALAALPAGLRLTGLNVSACSALAELPDDLEVLGPARFGFGRAGPVALPASARLLGDVFLNMSVMALPKGLHVGGNLQVMRCDYEALPPGLVVEGDLDVRVCGSLTALPSDARVQGRLVVFRCERVAALPATVHGSVALTGAAAVGALPDTWGTVPGDLELTDCAQLDALPAALRVRGSLRVVGTGVTELPEAWGGRLHVRGDLVLKGALTRLPRDELRVDGRFELSGCPQVTSLPPVLDVGGALEVAECGVEALPSAMRVGGHVTISRCPRLAALPRDLVDRTQCTYSSAKGGMSKPMAKPMAIITLSECPSLSSLPSGLRLKGLACSNCPLLTELPSDLVVEGDLRLSATAVASLSGTGTRRFQGSISLRDCALLVALPSGLHVRGSLSIDACGSLAQLPEGLHVDGGLALSSLPTLEKLPAGLVVDERFSVSACPLLRGLPTDARFGASVCVTGCGALVKLPSMLVRVRGDLDVSFGSGLVELPRGLTVEGDLDVSSCTALSELPDVRVHGNLVMDDCAALTTLPAGLDVGGNIVGKRSGLLGLPDHLRVRGNLVLDDCEDLVALPAGLSVGGELGLTGCVSLTELPDDDDFEVDGDLRMDGCAGIAALPDCVLAWGVCSDGQPHNIYLEGTSLPHEELARLQALDNPALRFHVSRRETFRGGDLAADDFPTLDDAAKFWAKEARVVGDALAIEPFVEAAYVRGVLGFLSKLRRAKEFNNSLTKAGLASRVVQVLELLAGENDGVREELVVRMADAVDTCSDKPMWAVNQMQVLVHIAEARGDRAKLRALGMGVMRLEVVHRHVRKAMDAMNFVDDVCVYLRFEIALRESLQLPVSALEMLYPSYVTVTDESIAAAEAEALGVTEADLSAWLPAWSEWQRQDRAEFAEGLDFAALERNGTKRLSLSLRTLRGSKVADPVRVRPAKAVWSLADLMKHWVNTGMDLNNTPRNVDYMRLNLTKCI